MNPPEASAGNPPDAGSRREHRMPDRLARLRHDLRTPAAHIQGYAEMLQEEVAEAGCAHWVPDLQRIESAGRQLVERIREDLAPERVASGAVDLRRLHADLRTPLNHVIGYSEMLLEQAEGVAPARFVSDLQRVHAAAANFLQRMEELLVPSALEALRPAGKAVVSHSHPDALALSREAPRVAAPPSSVVLTGTVLVVDDDPANRELLARRLVRQGFDVVSAEGGEAALRLLHQRRVDLVLLDLVMPPLHGDEVLARIKADPELRDLPVVMLSALDEMDSVVRCILMGAEDYLGKPCNTILLRARLSACLEKRRLRQQEQAYLRALESERQKSESLLLNILPRPIADRLKRGETTIVDSLAEVTVLFADLVDFTALTARLPSVEVVRLLDDIFCGFDTLAEAQGLEKIKTIGDAYMVVGGLPTPRADHAEAVAELALNMLRQAAEQSARLDTPIQLRLGINSGPVIAGIIGRHKFNYDLWGDTVNTASRMESHGLPGRIQVAESTFLRLRDLYAFEPRGEVDIKGKGLMRTWFLLGRK